jgi:hypothetical protein
MTKRNANKMRKFINKRIDNKKIVEAFVDKILDEFGVRIDRSDKKYWYIIYSFKGDIDKFNIAKQGLERDRVTSYLITEQASAAVVIKEALGYANTAPKEEEKN